MDLIDATKGTWKACRLTMYSAKNKLDVVHDGHRAASSRGKEDDEYWLWKDLSVRAGWCTGFLGKAVNKEKLESSLSSLLWRIAYYTTGEDLQDITPVRIMTPISFTAEPCAICKTLEQSYTPDDAVIRNGELDFRERYRIILDHLVADAYKIMAAGYYYYEKIEEIRDTLTGVTPAGHEWSKVLDMWDAGMERSQRFLENGRMCYAQSERAAIIKVEDVMKSQRESIVISQEAKYANAKPGTLKAVSGLYALNTELLCTTCKATVEPNPVVMDI